MLPPADKSQAAPACAGRGALEVSRSPRQRCLYLICIFYLNSDQLHGGFQRSRRQDGAGFLHTTNFAVDESIKMAALGGRVNGFSHHANQWHEHTCPLEVMSSLPDVAAANSPVYPPYGAMPNQFNPQGCLTNMWIQTVALFSVSKLQMSFLLSPRESYITFFFLLHGFHYRFTL